MLLRAALHRPAALLRNSGGAPIARISARDPRAMTGWYAGFELAVLLLLVANASIFATRGTAAEGLDSIAWLTLLVLFELETAHARVLSSRRALNVVHAIRMIAAAAVVTAAVAYLIERDWLDAANAWLWLGVVILLELKVRFVQRLARHRIVLESTAVACYLGLAAFAILWAWRGEWFDAYDAALWLVAFATIEMNVFKPLRRA